MAEFQDCLKYAIHKIGITYKLRPKQVETLHELFKGVDTIAVLPTGYGKSIIYQLLPFLMQKKFGTEEPLIVIVVAPLNSIMEDQVHRLGSKNLTGCFLSYDAKEIVTFDDDDKDFDDVDFSDSETEEAVPNAVLGKMFEMKELEKGMYNVIYGHPESLCSNTVMKMFNTRLYQQKVCGVVVDEVHMISEWGSEFRPVFQKLGDLTCVFPNACHLALTATCTERRKKDLIDILQYRKCSCITVNPDRPNIFLSKKSRLPNIRKYQKLDTLIEPIAVEISETLSDFPVTIMYVESLDALGYFYQFLDQRLGEKQYIGDHIPENRIFAQYHKDYTKQMKTLIVQDLCREKPKIRLVLATVALGMGLDAPGIVRVIHCRPPTTLESYMQEVGRAGRLGQPAEAILYFNNNDISKARKGISQSMIDYCQDEITCLRLRLVKHFGFNETQYSGDKSLCCSNCKNTD